MDENQRNAEKDIDITGPGREEKIIKPEPQQGGHRLSKKAKRYAMLGLVSICGLILLGVALSGRHGNKNSADGAFSNPDLIGQATPPSPPPVLASSESSLPLLGDGHEPIHKALGNDPLATTTNGVAGGQNSLTPAQKYREWLQDQYYKDLQGQVLAAQAAQSAPPGKAGERISSSTSLPGNASSVSVGNTPDFLRASLEAAKAGAGGASATGDQGSQNENKRFLEEQRKELDKNGYLAQSLQKPAGEHELFAGSIIPAVMITGINSDLPGEITAQVRQNVYDSLKPALVLIPQGARLIGQYSSAVAYGQQRVLVAWNRLINPNGSTIALQGMPGTDGMGQAGMNDQVDNHYMRIFGSAFLISMLGVGEQLSQPQNSSILTAPSVGQQAAAASAMELNNVGTQVLQKNLNIQPTLVIRPGYLFNVLVTRTMILPRYSE